MPVAEKKNSANRSLTQWLAHHQPTTVIAVDQDGEEHPIVVGKNARKWLIVSKAIADVDAVTVRAMSAEGLLATRTLRTIDPALASEEETAATPATAGGYDVTAVVQCVAKEVREAVEAAFRAAQAMHAATTSELTSMVKQLGERHAASEKALTDAREQIIAEREERIAEREEAAERAEAEAETAEKKEQLDLFKHIVGKALENPEIVSKVMGMANGKAPKIAATATPVTPPVKPNA